MIGTTRVQASELAVVATAMIDIWGVEAFHEAAAHVAISDLTSYMKLFLKVGTPAFVVRRLPRVLSHYCSHGELVVESSGDGRAKLSVHGVGCYGPAITQGAVGWIRAALEMSGAKQLELESTVGVGQATYDVCWRA